MSKIQIKGSTMTFTGDAAFGRGRTTKTGQTGGTLTLSDAENGTYVIEVSGTLTSNLSVLVATKEGAEWLVYNNTSGNYTVTFKTAAGTGVVVSQGKRAHILCDGTNVVAADADPQANGSMPLTQLSIALSDANTTLTYAQRLPRSLIFTGTLTAGRNVLLPDNAYGEWVVYNNTTGGFAITFKSNTGAGIAVAATKRAILECNGTDVVRVTADA